MEDPGIIWNYYMTAAFLQEVVFCLVANRNGLLGKDYWRLRGAPQEGQ